MYPMNWRAGCALAVVLLVALVANSCRAGGRCVSAVCAPVVHHKAAVVQKVIAEPVYQAPIVNYFVGAPVRQEALYAQAFEQALAHFKATTTTTTTKTTITPQPVQQPQHYAAPQQACPTCPPPATQQGYQPPQFKFTAPQPSPLDQSCAKCHTGDQAQGGFSFDAATPQQLNRAAERIIDGTMPPAGPLPPDQQQAALGGLYQEWLAARQAAADQ